MAKRGRPSKDEGLAALIIVASLLLCSIVPATFTPYALLFIFVIIILLVLVAIVVFAFSISRKQQQREKRRRLLLLRRDLQQLSPADFEIYVELLFNKMGYKTHRQGNVRASDQGIDIKAWRDKEYAIIQCKRFTGSNKVGVKDVRDLMGVVAKEQANLGYLVTSSGFTQSAWQWGNDTNIVLVTPKMIDIWLRQYQIGPYEQEQSPSQTIGTPKTDFAYAPPHLRPAEFNQSSLNESHEQLPSTPTQKQILSLWQVLLLIGLGVIAFGVCSCASLAALGGIVGRTPG